MALTAIAGKQKEVAMLHFPLITISLAFSLLQVQSAR